MRTRHSLTVSRARPMDVSGCVLACEWHCAQAEAGIVLPWAAASRGKEKHRINEYHFIMVSRPPFRSDCAGAKTQRALWPRPLCAPLWHRRSRARNGPEAARAPCEQRFPVRVRRGECRVLPRQGAVPEWRELRSNAGPRRWPFRRKASLSGIPRALNILPRYLRELEGALERSPARPSIPLTPGPSRCPAPWCLQGSGFAACWDTCGAVLFGLFPLATRASPRNRKGRGQRPRPSRAREEGVRLEAKACGGPLNPSLRRIAG